MDYEQFKQKVAENIKDYLPQRFADHEVSIETVVKNNVQLDALIIRSSQEVVTPSIYLEPLYEQMEKGAGFDEIMQNIADLRVDNDRDVEELGIDRVTDFAQAKDHIVARLIGIENNQELLAQRPYTRVEDLAITYHVDLGTSEGGNMSVGITDAIMQHYGIDKDELHMIAMENTQELYPAKFASMRDVMKEIFVSDMLADGAPSELVESFMDDMIPSDDGMYVLTNSAKMNGAVACMDSSVMDAIADQLGESFYVLPSSIHEVLIVPESAGIRCQELEEMVQSVNATEVLPQERLSDHVYAYDAKEHELIRAEKFEDRQADRAREASKGRNSEAEKKPSLKDRMAAKQKEVDLTKSSPAVAKSHKKDIDLS